MQFLPTHALSSRAADYARTYHHIKAPPGIVLSDLIRPAFWSHHTARLNIGDMIDVVAEDNTFDVTLRVIGKPEVGGGVHMRPLRIWQAGDPILIEEGPPVEHKVPAIFMQAIAAAAPENDRVPGFKINFASRQRWRVIRRADGALLKKDLMTEDAAVAWALANMHEIAA